VKSHCTYTLNRATLTRQCKTIPRLQIHRQTNRILIFNITVSQFAVFLGVYQNDANFSEHNRLRQWRTQGGDGCQNTTSPSAASNTRHFLSRGLILSIVHFKILKTIASSGFLRDSECSKFVFGRGFAPDPLGELTALPDPLAGLRGPYF